MSQNLNVINQVGSIYDPLAQTFGDQPAIPEAAGKRGEMIVNELNGRYHVANYRGHLFTANADQITVPVIASGLVNTFALYNPLNSGKYLDLIDIDIANVLAATIVDAVGIYQLVNPTQASATKGVIYSGIAGTGAASVASFYTAVTNTSQTPVLQKVVGGYGATTAQTGLHYDFDGKLLVPPGVQISLAMSKTVSTTSGLTVSMTWMELPL